MNYYAVERSDSLSHFGILGMQWGVRRFQNKDGTLTSEGKRRYSNPDGSLNAEGRAKFLTADGRLTEEGKTLAKEVAEGGYLHRGVVSDELAEKIGLKKGEDYDVIKKGSELTRIAGEGDKIDEKRKYASMTPWDNQQYESDAEFLPIIGTPNQFKYDAIKDLRVAKPGEVTDFVISKYGDTKISDLPSDSFEYSGPSVEKLLADYGSITMKELHAAAETTERIANTRWDTKNPDIKWLRDRSVFLDSQYANFIHQKLAGVDPKASQEVFSEFKKRGYDAVVDPEDYKGGDVQYPLILLNPKSSIKEKSKRNLYG